jgi:hypothetical protein
MTAVEYLLEKWAIQGTLHSSDIAQAKEMEKDQKKFFFECGRNFQLTGEGTFEEVYNETLKSE